MFYLGHSVGEEFESCAANDGGATKNGNKTSQGFQCGRHYRVIYVFDT